MEKWFGKIAVVTGASAGIGAAIVESLANEGVHVVGLARRKDRIEALATKNKAAKGKIYAVECDVTCSQSISKAFDWIERTLGGVDILVNNAGTYKKAAIFDLEKPEEDYLVSINTNLTGLLLVTRRAFKTMQDKPAGYIININSVAGQQSVNEYYVKFGLNVYAATKHAVTQLTDLMRLEFADTKKNIRISSLSPGAVRTEIDLAGNFRKEGEKAMWDFIPHLLASDIADQVVYLLSTKPNISIKELTVEALPQAKDIRNL